MLCSDYDKKIAQHALCGMMRKKGISEDLILEIKSFCHSKARGFPRNQTSVDELLKLDKKVANIIYSLWLDGVMEFKGITMFNTPTSYIGTHWIKYYPLEGRWEEDHRFTNTERFKLLLPEFKSLINRALETRDPKAFIQAHQKRLDEIREQYKIDSEIAIK